MKCKKCGMEIKPKNKETPEIRYLRIFNNLKKLFKEDDNTIHHYTRNYIGYGRIMSYICPSCKNINIDKPRNVNWLLNEDKRLIEVAE